MSKPAADPFQSELIQLLPRLRRFALGLTADPAQADDLVQAGCERALSRRQQWQPGTRLDSWMFRIVQNLWIDQTRRRRTRGETAVLDDALHIAGEDGREVTERRLMLGRVREAFGGLAPELREAAGLVILNGMSYREAAETLGVPIGTIMSRVSRSRRALEEALGAGRAQEAVK